MDHSIQQGERGAIVGAVEAELSRLRRARPTLNGRLDKAEHILTVQLSVGAHMRPIKLRGNQDGHVYRVASQSKLGKAYTVDPSGAIWSCDCQWGQHGGRACSHALAAYILQRAANRQPSALTTLGPRCDGCGERHPASELQEVVEDSLRWADGLPLSYFEGDRLCGSCYAVAS